jgi:hypothetical protein
MESPGLTSLGENIANGSTAVDGTSGTVVTMAAGTVVRTAVLIMVGAATEGSRSVETSTLKPWTAR